MDGTFGVGIMLKGGGTVEPVSKKDIHSLVRENFHSVSDFSEITWKIENLVNLRKLFTIRVSNGAGFSCPVGQRDRSFFIVLGQRDNGTSSKSCHGRGRDGILTVCPVLSWDGTRDRRKQREKKYNFWKKNKFFWQFLTFFCQWGSDFVPGRPRTEDFDPGFFCPGTVPSRWKP